MTSKLVSCGLAPSCSIGAADRERAAAPPGVADQTEAA
jgi:hypothetical protein